MRQAHFLKHSKGTDQPANVVWVDTETTPRKESRGVVSHHLAFGWAAHQRTIRRGEWTQPEWLRFEKPAQFWKWVESKARDKSRLFVFAHNWSFDALVIDTFGELPRRGWQLGRAIIESPPVILAWRKGQATILMLDTLNWWRVPLKQLGESLGVRKLEMPRPKASPEEWDAYCRQDVEVIRAATHAWWRFLDDYDLGGFANTLAGQALRTYRHRFMPDGLLIDSHVEATALSRESYHGGRTECFRLGRIKGPIHCLDVNSMYPAVMRNEEYPLAIKLWTRRATAYDLAVWRKRYALVARVTLQTDLPAYCVNNGERLIFPVGQFQTVLTSPEIDYALKMRHIRQVHDVAIYTKARLFQSFVDTLYGLRLKARAEGNDTQAFLLKILMNSLYGKFGQRGGVWETVGKSDPNEVGCYLEYDADTATTRSFRKFGGVLQEKMNVAEARDSHPAIAAHVTAYARMRLWHLMVLAGRSNVFYCDTDSLYVNGAGMSRLAGEIDSGAIGKLKLEHTYPWVVLHGPKDYQTPVFARTKGVRANAIRLAENVVSQEQWSSIPGSVRTERIRFPITKRVVKHLSREYKKGLVLRDGRIQPFTLSLDG